MKKIILSTIILLTSAICYSQFPQKRLITNNQTNAVFDGGAQVMLGLINGVYTDTTAANAGYIDFYNGAQIWTRSDRNFWLRDSVLNMWIRIAKYNDFGVSTGYGILNTGTAQLSVLSADTSSTNSLVTQFDLASAIGGVPGMRFGKSGEDATAAENRDFNLNGNDYTVQDGNLSLTISNTNDLISMSSQRVYSGSTYDYSYSMPTVGIPYWQLLSSNLTSGSDYSLIKMFPAANNPSVELQGSTSSGSHSIQLFGQSGIYLNSSGFASTSLFAPNLPRDSTKYLMFYNPSDGQIKYDTSSVTAGSSNTLSADQIGVSDGTGGWVGSNAYSVTSGIMRADFIKSENVIFKSELVPDGNSKFFQIASQISGDQDSTTGVVFQSLNSGLAPQKTNFYIDRFGNTVFGLNDNLTGVANYYSNRSSSYTARSFTDKNYVDSAISAAAGSGLTGSGVANRVAYWSGASSLTSSANFTFSGSALVVTGSIQGTGTVGANALQVNEITTPSTPSSGTGFYYFGDGDSKPRAKADDGTVYVLTRPSLVKGLTIESPSASENIGMWKTPVAITVSSLEAVLVGSASPSVTFQISFGSDRTSGTNVYTSGRTVTSTTTGSTFNSSFNDATIPAGSFIWVTTSAVSGTVTQIELTINYTED